MENSEEQSVSEILKMIKQPCNNPQAKEEEKPYLFSEKFEYKESIHSLEKKIYRDQPRFNFGTDEALSTKNVEVEDTLLKVLSMSPTEFANVRKDLPKVIDILTILM